MERKIGFSAAPLDRFPTEDNEDILAYQWWLLNPPPGIPAYAPLRTASDLWHEDLRLALELDAIYPENDRCTGWPGNGSGRPVHLRQGRRPARRFQVAAAAGRPGAYGVTAAARDPMAAIAEEIRAERIATIESSAPSRCSGWRPRRCGRRRRRGGALPVPGHPGIRRADAGWANARGQLRGRVGELYFWVRPGRRDIVGDLGTAWARPAPARGRKIGGGRQPAGRRATRVPGRCA